MDEFVSQRIILRQSQPATHHSEQETAEYSHVEIHTIRRLHSAGMIEGIEVIDGERRYLDADLARLRFIRRLRQDLGVNLAGIEVIQHLLKRIDSLHEELQSYRAASPEHEPGTNPE